MNDVPVKFFAKKDRSCMACGLVRKRLSQYKVNFVEVTVDDRPTPALEYKGQYKGPPISSRDLKVWLIQNKIIKGIL